MPLVQTHHADGSAMGLPSKPSPLVFSKQFGGAESGSLARACLRTFCCSSPKALSYSPSTTGRVHSVQAHPLFGSCYNFRQPKAQNKQSVFNLPQCTSFLCQHSLRRHMLANSRLASFLGRMPMTSMMLMTSNLGLRSL